MSSFISTRNAFGLGLCAFLLGGVGAISALHQSRYETRHALSSGQRIEVAGKDVMRLALWDTTENSHSLTYLYPEQKQVTHLLDGFPDKAGTLTFKGERDGKGIFIFHGGDDDILMATDHAQEADLFQNVLTRDEDYQNPET